jgi:polygalacturonase
MSLNPKTPGRSVRAKAKPVLRAVPDADKSPDTNGDATEFKRPTIETPVFAPRDFDIRDHGAVCDGQTEVTEAIAGAICACAEAGGGRVLIPPGAWLTGPIHLRSNVELHLREKASLRFSADPAKYLPPVFVRWGGLECYNYSPLIYARDCLNIAITGPGQLLGQGKPWWNWAKVQQRVSGQLYKMVLDGTPVEQRRLCTDQLPLRPQFIMAIDCANVLLDNFSIVEGGPSCNIHLAYCRNAIVRRIAIDAPDGPSNDGIEIDSSRDVLVEDCEIRTSDDCISLKSGMNEDGWRVDRPTENILIQRIRATAGEGGIAIGSEMSAGVRNVLVQNCRYDGVRTGIRMQAARGRGGVVQDVFVQDVEMGRILGDAIQVTTEHSSFIARDGRVPTFRNIHIRNVDCQESQTAVRMVGLPDRALSNIYLENVTIACQEGLHCAAVNLFHLRNVSITPTFGPVMSVRDGQEVVIDGLNNAQSASVFLDLRGRQTRNIRLRGEPNNKVRPAVVLGIDVPRDALVHE